VTKRAYFMTVIDGVFYVQRACYKRDRATFGRPSRLTEVIIANTADTVHVERLEDEVYELRIMSWDFRTALVAVAQQLL